MSLSGLPAAAGIAASASHHWGKSAHLLMAKLSRLQELQNITRALSIAAGDAIIFFKRSLGRDLPDDVNIGGQNEEWRGERAELRS